jgi:tryptophan-rich sensory protein
MTMPRQVVGLVGWLLLVFAAAAVGAVASLDAPTFYAELRRPAWAPPAWLFGPVWSVLYALMGVSAWLVWRGGGFAATRRALLLFVVQLAVNASWSWLFFAWRQGGIAFVDVLLLWLLIGGTVFLFWRISKLGATLLVPYWAWVTFAAALTFSVWRLNPERLA